MGISKDIFVFLLETLAEYIPANMKVNMVEIGNQHFLAHNIPSDGPLKTLVAKDYFESHGIYHTSIDITGWDRSIPMDLSIPIPSYIKNNFNVLTNFGTSEHIDGQYICFQNFHDLLEINGIMIHDVPLVGHWPNHCHWYYDAEFFDRFCGAERPYKLLRKGFFYSNGQGLTLAAALQKINDAPFIPVEEFGKGIVYTGGELNILEYWTPFSKTEGA